jgi:hypothetical protein
VSSGGAISGTVTFVNSGLLVLNQASNFGSGALVAGFDNVNTVFDLKNIAFASNPTIGFTEAGNLQSGTVTVSGGGVSDSLTLIGTYLLNYFTTGADGTGGTTLVDQPLVVSAGLAQNPHG